MQKASQDPLLVSRYVLLSTLGRGGRGVVYKAYDPMLERQVAIKLLRPEKRDDDEPLRVASERLVREAQAIARLSHPNVVAVFDVGTFDGGPLFHDGAKDGEQGVFVVMEYVQGPTLARYIAEGRPWRDIQPVFLAAGRGLAAAHAAGMIHRDFKPANVIVADDGRVRVLDFGLARVTGPHTPHSSSVPTVDESPTLEDASRENAVVPMAELDGLDSFELPLRESESGAAKEPLTRGGVVMGTPAYMAPEQHFARPIGPAADQYAFCISLFEALYGRRPFRQARSQELARAKQRRKIEWPNERRRVPDQFARIIKRGLEPAPDKRFASMDDLLRELARDPTAPRRRLMAAASLAVVALGSVIGVQQWRAYEARVCITASDELAGVWDDERRQTLRRAFEDSREVYAADTWRHVEREIDLAVTVWTNAREAACRDRRSGAAEHDDRVELCLDTHRAAIVVLVDELARGDTAAILTAVELVHEIPDASGCSADSAGRFLDPTGKERSIELATKLMRARAALAQGRRANATELLEQVVAVAREHELARVEAQACLLLARAGVERTDNLVAAWRSSERVGDDRLALEAMAGLLGEMGTIEEGLAKVVAEKMARTELDPVSEAHLELALSQASTRAVDFEDALARSNRALSLLEAATSESHPLLVQALSAVGHVLHQLARYGEAAEYWERAQTIIADSLGPDHPWGIGVWMGLATSHWEQGDLERAQSDLERALAIATTVHGGDDPRIVSTLHRLGDLHNFRGNPQKGVEIQRRALAIVEHEHEGRQSAAVARAHAKLAAALNSAGNREDALVHADRAVAIDRATGTDFTTNLAKHALILLDLERWEEAEGEWQIIVDELGRRPPTPYGLPWANTNLARAKLGRGQRETAITLLEQVLREFEPLETKDLDHQVAEARFALARAIVDDDPTRAIHLARKAHAAYLKHGPANRHTVEMASWLADHEVKAGAAGK